MTAYLGDVAPSSIVDLKFTTVGTTGVPTQLAGTPVVSVYKDNGTTESTSGVTLTVDFDSRTGLNHVRIDTSADGTFYAAGSNFQVVITAGTVGGSSVVGYVVGQFSVNHRSALRPTTAGRTLDVSAGGEAGVDWANVGTPGSTVNLSGTTVKTLTDAPSDSGGVTTLLSRLSATRAGYLDNLSAGAAALEASVQTLLTRLSATRAGYLDNLSGGAVALADKLLAYVQLLARSDAAITTDRATELGEINADEGSGAGDYAATADSGEAIRDRGDAAWSGGGGLTAQDVRDAMKLAPTAGSPAAGSVDKHLDDIEALATAVDGNVDVAVSTRSSHNAADVWSVGTRTLTSISALVPSIWAGITATAANFIADHVGRRRSVNMEGSSDGDTIVAADSLYGMIQQHRASDTTTNPGSLTVFESDGITELEQLTLATDAAAEPVTGIG